MKAAQHGLGDSSMLERIDELFACGAGEHINIPQIVVVGDQSSGKSSVLSGLIRKDLPRDSGLCTRFATKIVFRRAKERGIRASIIPDENAGVEHRAAITAWGELSVDSFDDFTFADIMKEVHNVIGIASPNDLTSGTERKPTFSGDVLQLEISGPEEEHLSVIDVPGIFRDFTPGLTTKADIQLVRSMVMRYMENPRSVMLTVVPANVDVATQEILHMANDLDPEGDRTLGVLTKPDLVDVGAEHRIIDLVEGRARQIKLGWHILRNPGQNDLGNPAFDRQREEMDFFRNKRFWSDLNPENVGIEALRNRLKDVLSGLIRREFTNVRLEVQKNLDIAESKLKALGPERNSRAAQAAYLTGISTRFQHLVDMALSAKFGADSLFEEHEDMKIAPAVVLRMEEFGTDMLHFGHQHSFQARDQHQRGNLGFQKDKKVTNHRNPQNIPSASCVRKWTKRTDLEGLLSPPKTLHRSSSEKTDKWLQELYRHSRGFELGTFDPAILASAMRKQTTNWRSISAGVVSDIAVITHTFISKALVCLCPNERFRDDLYNLLFEDLKTRYEKAMQQLQFILTVELEGTPMTQSHYFIDLLEESRQARFITNLEDLAIDDIEHGKVVRLNELMMKHPMSNDQYLVRDIHDILQSYYEVARKRFTDNVCKQAIDYFLVTGPDTPLRVFAPIFVSQLTDEQLERIAKEEPQVQKQRSKLVNDIDSLRKAKRVLA